MDKEAQEKLAQKLARRAGYLENYEAMAKYYLPEAAAFLSWIEQELGYRKLKDKPPLLSDEELRKLTEKGIFETYFSHYPHIIAQAQRKSDIKYYETLLSR